MASTTWRQGLLLALGLAAFTLPVQAEQAKVGIAAAVNPETVGTPLEGETRALILGNDVMYKERVLTKDNGQAQILFLDQSALTIAPKSEVVIDEFIYNPSEGTGKLAATITQGLMRFVGGKLSKESDVTFSTPTATIGVRGGVVLVAVEPNGATRATFLYGQHMTVTGLGVTQTVTRPGFLVTTQTGEAPSPPTQAPRQLIQRALGALEGHGNTTGGGSQKSTDQRVAQTTLAKDAEKTNPGSVSSPSIDQRVAETTLAKDAEKTNPGSVSSPSGSRQPPKVVVIDFSKVADQGQKGAQQGARGSIAAKERVLGGAFKATSTSDGSAGTSDFSGNLDQAYRAGVILNGHFSAALSGGNVFLPVPSAGQTLAFGTGGTSSPLGPVSGFATFTTDGQLLFYNLVARTGRKAFLFAGSPISSTAKQSSGFAVDTYSVQQDFMLQSALPFIRQAGGGNLGNGYVSPLYMTMRDSGNIGSGTSTSERTTAFLAGLVINGQGASQKSAGEVSTFVLGNDGSTGNLLLAGGVVASGRQSATGQSVISSSSVTSQPDGSGNAFFGNNKINDFVLDNAQVNSNPFTRISTPNSTDQNLDRTNATNYGFNQVVTRTGSLATASLSRTSQTMSGYAAGLGQVFNGTLSTPFIMGNANNAPGDLTIQTFAALNRLSAQFNLQAESGSPINTMVANFGGAGGSNGDFFGNQSFIAARSSFASDSLFAAREQRLNDGTVSGTDTSTVDGSAVSRAHLGMVTSDAVNVVTANFVPSGVSFCQCQYLKWGFWLGDATNSDGSKATGIHLATWVAGTLPGLATIPASGTATYTGHIIGNVYNNGAQYLAVGNFQNTWNFAANGGLGGGTATVTQFDGLTFSNGSMSTSNRRDYSGTFNDTGGTRQITLRGSFFKGGGDPVAATGGQFKIVNTSGPVYKAAGIFAAKH